MKLPLPAMVVIVIATALVSASVLSAHPPPALAAIPVPSPDGKFRPVLARESSPAVWIDGTVAAGANVRAAVRRLPSPSLRWELCMNYSNRRCTKALVVGRGRILYVPKAFRGQRLRVIAESDSAVVSSVWSSPALSEAETAIVGREVWCVRSGLPESESPQMLTETGAGLIDRGRVSAGRKCLQFAADAGYRVASSVLQSLESSGWRDAWFAYESTIGGDVDQNGYIG